MTLPGLDDAQLARYARQVLLPEIGYEGQQRIAAGQVLVLGLGGLGSPVALYLAAAGTGTLVLVDDDHVDASNLQRQIAHTNAAIGRPKVESAAERCRALNPQVAIRTHARRPDTGALAGLVATAGVIVDCSDNYATRHALNAACRAARKPLVSGAAIRWSGQLAVFDASLAHRPKIDAVHVAVRKPQRALMRVVAVSLAGMASETGFIKEVLIASNVGESHRVGPYDVKFAGLEPVAGPNWTALEATLEARRGNGEPLILKPQSRMFANPPTETNEAAIRTVLDGQLYLVLGKQEPSGRWQLRMWWKPFVTLIWLGGAMIAFGGFLALIGRFRRDRLSSRGRALA